MSRLDDVFVRLRREGRRALMPFLTAGDPDLATTERAIDALVAAGADIIELGIPFSDPIADGPRIQAANARALAGGIRTEDVFALVERNQARWGVPICFLLYANTIVACGEARFAKRAAQAGVAGLIVPDLPPDEAGELAPACADAGVDLIRFLAPTTPDARVQAVAAGAQGFIYVVSLTGVTGTRESLSARLRPFLERLRRLTEVPLCVGFGISTPAHAAEVAQLADGVIVGTAVVDRLARGADGVAEAGAFVKALRDAVDGVAAPA